MKRMNLRALCEGAMMVALATALSFLKPYELPQGGSVCIGTLPLLLFAVRWGWRDGGLAGLAYGILQLLVDGAYACGWASMLLDYGIAFSFLGLAAGLFRGKKHGIYWGTLAGSAARFVAHFISGVTVYRIVVPTTVLNITFADPYLYSLVYNGSYVFLNMLLCMLLFALMEKPLGKYLRGEDIRG